MGLHRSVDYSFLNSNRLLGSRNKQEKSTQKKQILVKKNVISLTYSFRVLVNVSAVIKMFKLPSLLQPSIKKLPIFDKSLATFNLENVNDLKEVGECIDI